MENQKNEFAYKWQILCAVMSGGFMASVDSSVVNLILPTLVKYFHSDFSNIQWVVVSYLLTVAALILTMGRLGDIIGKKRVYLSGFIIFTVGSLLCGFSVSEFMLIGFRIIQGIGATMILALGFAVATEAFPGKERGKAMGILAAIVSLGVVVGPLIGGFLVDYASWHWIFFINIPVGITGIVLILKYVPNKRSDKPQKFDLAGAFLFLLCMLTLLLGLTWGQKYGFGNRPTILLLGSSLLSGLIFIIIELKLKEPMINLGIFKNYFLSVNLLVIFLFYFAISGVFVLAPFYLQNVLGYMPNQMGMLFGAMSVMMFFFSPVSGILSDKLGTPLVITISLVVMLVIYFVISTSLKSDMGDIQVIVAMVILGSGMGFFMSPSHSAVMGAISYEYLGIVSGLLILARTLGQTAGVAVLGAVWVSRSKMYNGGELLSGVSSASSMARIKGLEDIFEFVAYLTLLSLILIITIILRQRKDSGSIASNSVSVK